jgi:hypothetical protein
MSNVFETFHFIDVYGSDGYMDYRSPFMIIDTRERGRIMYCHTNRIMGFEMGETEVIRLFYKYQCDCLITCYPAKHYREHPELARELHILYPECDVITQNDFKESNSGVIRIGID